MMYIEHSNENHHELSEFYEQEEIVEYNSGSSASVMSTGAEQLFDYKRLDIENLVRGLVGKHYYELYKIEDQIQMKQSINSDEIFITVPIELVPGLFGISVDFIHSKDQIVLKSYLIKLDFSPYYAANKNIINVLSFHALKQNDKLEQGAFSIDPFSGLYSYKTVLKLSMFQKMKLDQSSILEFLQEQFHIHKVLMKKSAPKLLFLMNKIEFQQMKLLNENYQNELAAKEKQIDFAEIRMEKSTKLMVELKEIVKIKMKTIPLLEDKGYFEGIPRPKSLPLCTEINVENKSDLTEEQIICNWRKNSALINIGGYSEIRKEQISFSSGANPNQLLKRTLAVKTDKYSDKNQERKVAHEIQIIRQLKGEQNQNNENGASFIVSSYVDKKFQDCYFMELYSNGSLEQFITSKNITLSLRTKIFLLAGVISGVDFMHSKQIAHLDLKLGNILVQKQLIPKICDFGEAQKFSEMSQEKHKYSRSLPFAAPELFSDKYPVTPAYDIFSFGMIMSLVIFEQFPFDFNPNDYSSLEERYKNSTYCVKRSFVYQLKQGPKKILKQCYAIMSACIHPDPNERPKPKWIQAALWKMIHFLDSF